MFMNSNTYTCDCGWLLVTLRDLLPPGANGVELDKRNAKALVEQVISSSFTSI